MDYRVMTKFQPYIDFYGEYSISPVSQNILDEHLLKHLQRRDALYRHLGIVPSLLKGKSVLEFGPGSGHNAIFTNKQIPAKFVLVDANKTGLEESQKNIAEVTNTDNVEFVYSLIEEYQSEEKFDLVLCEALIPFQLDPVTFVKAPAQFVKENGIFVITCTDSVAVLSDWMKRLYGAILVQGEHNLERRLEILHKPFESHLSSLKGMSRPIDDWLLDNVIQCLDYDIGRGLFSIDEAISALGDDFDAYQSSPNYVNDWRWYKDIHGKDRQYNEIFKEQYIQNIHSSLDYRNSYQPREAKENLKLLSLCDHTFNLIHTMLKKKLVTDKKMVESLKLALLELSDEVRLFNAEAADALSDFKEFLNQIDDPKSYQFTDFIPFWGRGTQYLSLIKKEK